MTTHPDDELEFDFFEEPSTQETAVRRPARRGVPRRPPRPPSGITPLLRLIGLIAVAILVVVLLVFWVQSCRGSSKRSSYESYMDGAARVAADSDAIGKEFGRVIIQRGIKQNELESKLSGLAQRQQQIVGSAQTLDPPGPLLDENESLIEALQLRVSGLRGLESAFRRTAKFKNADKAGKLLAVPVQRLLASDVVWADLFKAPARDQLKREGIGGVRVPGSTFLSDDELASAATLKPIWQGLHGAATGGGGTTAGPHGNGIESVKALPSGQELSTGTETAVKATTDLSFDVAVENSGASPESGVEVVLTIQKSPQPIVRRETIPVINPGEQQTVTFSDLGDVPIATPTTIKVEVKPVPGEVNTTNNSADYPVIFSLP